jgi:serine protease Do
MIRLPNIDPRRARRLSVWLAAALSIIFLDSNAAYAQDDFLAPDDQQYLERFGRANRAARQKVSPAVVLVTTTHDWGSLQQLLPPSHPPLDEDEMPSSRGSGTIVRADGYILSNYHVVKGADSILVELADRRVFGAQVVGFDSLIDIALLKIPATNLPTVRLGDSDQLQIGDWVLAIGHPLGQGSTLTGGIVSALGVRANVLGQGQKAQDRKNSIESFIQTDAVINPGNSGGPLLNSRGEVIGINTAISTLTGFYMGYGLAVPSNLAQEAVNDLITYGRVVRGYMGVSMKTVDQRLIGTKRLALDLPRGVYIDSVSGPGADAGLRAGDVILRVDGHPVNRSNQVQTLIYGMDPGNEVAVALLRGSEEIQAVVRLGDREADLLLARGRERISRLGFAVQDLTPTQALQLGFNSEVAAELGFVDDEHAIVVTAVDPDGPAAAKGITMHDVITEVDQQRITSLKVFMRFISQLQEDESALFWLWRQNEGVEMRALRIPQ